MQRALSVRGNAVTDIEVITVTYESAWSANFSNPVHCVMSRGLSFAPGF